MANMRVLLTSSHWSIRLFFLFYTSICYTSAQLVINVKNQGGDILQEVLVSNVTEDVVRLEFQRADGTLVTQLVDFAKEVQIYRLIILTEEEQVMSGTSTSNSHQTICFATKLSKQDFIAADAIAKLRQKNPHTIRYPEEDSGRENATFEYNLDLFKSHVISSHIAPLCKEAIAIYAQEADLRLWAAMGNQNEAFLVLNAAQHQPKAPSRCKDSPFSGETSSLATCQCRLSFCVPWYPCGLKFCRGHDQQTGKALSYRCGIKTCKKCLDYTFPTSHRLLCPWDD